MSLNTVIIQSIYKELKDTKINFMAVTKNREIDDIINLYNLGVKIFGENRVQEAEKKFKELPILSAIELHLIGPLQSNKIKKALNLFDAIQSIDNIDTIEIVCKYLNQFSKTKKFYIQVNIGNESQKSGVKIENLNSLYDFAISKNLQVEGLMCIPPLGINPNKYFEQMVEIKNKLNNNLKLSMGMSNDYKIAINHGTNLVRLGSILFE